MNTIAERVAKGAALLDEKKPGWWQKVNPHTLVIANCFACVLGQVYGEYTRGRNALGLDHGDARTYGFNAAYVGMTLMDLAKMREEFAALNNEWRDLITLRRLDFEAATTEQTTEKESDDRVPVHA